MNAKKLAEQLREAELSRKEIVKLTDALPSLSFSDAYKIQEELEKLHLERTKLSGFKMGMTSKAKMEQMGVRAPICGFLTEAMNFSGRVKLAQFIHPRIEPEIVFRLGKKLSGKPSSAEALAACDAIGVALEIIDSRYKDFHFLLPDVVADNCSAAGYVLPESWVSPKKIDHLENIGLVMEKNGKPVAFGSSAAILGHPARSLAALAELLAEREREIPAGSIVLAGGATAAVEIAPGDRIRLLADGLASAEIFCE